METILVIDDDPVIRSLCQSILKLGGYLVLLAGTGAEALRVIENKVAPIDLVLLDIVMPGMNGIEVARRIRATKTDTPIVLMTGYSVTEIADIVGDKSPYRVIWKPFKADSLLRMIENVLHL